MVLLFSEPVCLHSNTEQKVHVMWQDTFIQCNPVHSVENLRHFRKFKIFRLDLFSEMLNAF